MSASIDELIEAVEIAKAEEAKCRSRLVSAHQEWYAANVKYCKIEDRLNRAMARGKQSKPLLNWGKG